MFLIWLQFFIGAFIIVVSGARLCFYADIISEKLRLSKVLIGIILLGIVTSLPELATSLASSIKLDSVDLALGNVLGSNNFNLLIIVILDFLYKTGSITSRTDSSRFHIVSAIWSLALLIIVILSIIINSQFKIFSIGNIGLGSILIALIYIIAIKLISQSKTEESNLGTASENSEISTPRKVTLSRAGLCFLIASIFVVASGMWLASIGDQIAQMTGWGQTFVGSIFLAMATSFPELVVSIAALRLGSIDMSFGNIFGSNMINLFIIPINDIVYRKGAILSFGSTNHILTIALAIFLTFIVIIGLTKKKKNTFLHLGWDTRIMLVSYILGTYILFRLR